MIKRTKVIILLISFTFSITFSKEIRIGLETFEPFYIPSKQSGLIPDLISAVFQHMPGYQPKFYFGYSNKRLLNDFTNGKWDAISNLNSHYTFNGCLTDPIFIYNNVAITIKNANINIESISDLTGKNIVTFQDAINNLGKEFSDSVSLEQYIEVLDTKLQVSMLNRERVDVSVGDKFIFIYNLRNMTSPVRKLDDFKFHDIFEPTYTHMGFHDPKICKIFNNALKLVQESGEFTRIYKFYTN